MTETIQKIPNELIHETSPYLLQHAYNPVKWMAYSEEAFAKAESENKLIIISIGYSSCHWCHVMEHESFEDELIAEEMNKNYICIKVDREERPDVDGYYMDACQIMTGRGGWPLNAFTLPDGRPVYVGTYFPKNSWKGLLHELASGYKFRKQKYIDYADKLEEGIKGLGIVETSIDNEQFITDSDLSVINEGMIQYIDRQNGGRGRAPKFPMPDIWTYLYHLGTLYDNNEAVNLAHLTLDKMAKGGIYDQIGGGFSRYSTDDKWKVPHFEKMLYDNAQLIGLYALGYKMSGNQRFKSVCEETIRFLERDLSNGEGGYYTALDADSEGIEGKFYVWNEKEINLLFPEGTFQNTICYQYLGIGKEGFWEHDYNILLESKDLLSISEELNINLPELEKELSDIKTILFNERENKIKPGLDNKIILSNNALLISGLCTASKYLDNNNYLDKAIQINDYIESHLINEKGELIRVRQKDEKHILGFLEDYAYYIKALIDLYQNTGDESYIMKAKSFMEVAIADFYDTSSGYFYFSKIDTTSRILNKIETSDNVTPSPNAVMAENLLILSKIFSYENDYYNISVKMMNGVLSKIKEHSSFFGYWANIILRYQYGIKEITLVAESKNTFKDFPLRSAVLPFIVWMFNEKDSPTQIEQINDKKLMEGESTTYYICQDKVCQFPLSTIEISDVITS